MFITVAISIRFCTWYLVGMFLSFDAIYMDGLAVRRPAMTVRGVHCTYTVYGITLLESSCR
jgi:hypothetical protein